MVKRARQDYICTLVDQGFVDKGNINNLGVKIKIKKPLSGIMGEHKLHGDMAKNETRSKTHRLKRSGHRIVRGGSLSLAVW